MAERYAIEHKRPRLKDCSTQTKAEVPCTTKKMKTKDKIIQTDSKGKLATKSTFTSLASTADKDTVTDLCPSTSDCACQVDHGTPITPSGLESPTQRNNTIGDSPVCSPQECPKPAEVLVIKGVPLSVPLGQISQGLVADGFCVSRICRFRSRKTNKITPIQLTLSEANSKILSVKKISGYFVKVAHFKSSVSTTTNNKDRRDYGGYTYHKRPPGYNYFHKESTWDRNLLYGLRRLLYLG